MDGRIDDRKKTAEETFMFIIFLQCGQAQRKDMKV